MAKFIVKNRKIFFAAFLVALMVAGVLQSQVKVNYTLTDYLPIDSEFMRAFEINGEQFGTNSVIRAMVGEITEEEATALETSLGAIDHIDSVTLNEYDAEASAGLFVITFDEDLSNDEGIAAIAAIRTIQTGKPVYLSGGLVNNLSIQTASSSESLTTIILLIPIILFILFLTSSSWIEPLISLTVILVAIVISMGTNVLFVDGISYITKSILAALTMAISMDYSIFLLHAFKEERKKGSEPLLATIEAVKRSFTTITASSLTTIAGFAALLVMKFTLGGDMGWVFAKTIVIALLTVLFFMPALLMMTYKIIEKTTHKEYLPSFVGLGRFAVRHKAAILIAMVLVAIPAIYGQYNNRFIYGASAMTEAEGSAVYQDNQAINGVFGTGNQVILLFPNQLDLDQEKALYDALLQIQSEGQPVVKTASKSYAQYLDAIREQVVATGLLPSTVTLVELDALIQDPDSSLMHTITTFRPAAAATIRGIAEKKPVFMTDEYSRIFLELDTPEEGDATFAVLDEISAVAEEFYPDAHYLYGASSGAFSIKKAVEIDYVYVNLIAIASIMILIAISFRSFSLPPILLFVIEIGIFFNMAIPFFLGQSLSFVGYLIISSVQLGATIDYAILMTDKYLFYRKTADPKEAAIGAVSSSAPSILTSGGILTLSGLAMNLVSTNPLVQQIGSMVMRAGIFSMFLILFLLPGLLVLCDKAIQKTTKNKDFYSQEKTVF